jgi:mono/diheme cytochrome c family protein
MSTTGASPLPDNDTLPVMVSDTVTRGTVAPTYPVLQYSHSRDGNGGDGIANGFVYTGSDVPALRNRLVFGDITTGHIWYADIADVRAADDGVPDTLATIHQVTTNLRPLTEAAYRARGGRGAALPGFGAVSGQGRVDVRFAVDNTGEPYLLTKSDGMIRKIVGAREVAATTAAGPASTGLNAASAAGTASSTSAGLTNPVPSTPASITRGREIYDVHCASCHGPKAEGAARAGIAMMFTAITRGVPPTMMAGYDGRIADQDVWHMVNYIRSLAR